MNDESTPHYVTIEVEEFLETGLLGLINLLVLWPRGLALAARFDTNGHADLCVRKLVPFDQIVDVDTEAVFPGRVRALCHFDAERFS